MTYVIACLEDDRNPAIKPWFHPHSYREHGAAMEALIRINARRKNHGMSPASVYELTQVQDTLL